MSSLESWIDNGREIEVRLGYSFKNRELLALAFVHCSFFNENRECTRQHNERLEFLGDSVLGIIISEYLYERFPHHPEGDLSHLRAQLVESTACAAFVEKLAIAPYLLLGKGERRGDGRGRETILGDLFEALIGAIYLDGGLDVVKLFFFNHFQEDVERILKSPLRNWKAELQDYSQKRYQKPPRYQVVKETGPDHSKCFHVVAIVGEHSLGEGVGCSKKEAEQAAAEVTLQKLGDLSTRTHG
jgi:ribonuclease III